TYLGFNPVRARAAGSGPPKADIVSGATATVLILGESVVRSASRVARLLQLGGATATAAAGAAGTPGAAGAAGSAGPAGSAPAGAAGAAGTAGVAPGAPDAAGAVPAPGAAGTARSVRANARVVDPQAGSVADWTTLRKQGAIAHLRVTVGE